MGGGDPHPAQEPAFRRLGEWGFNIQRRVQRLQETDRWAGPVRDYKIAHVSRAGRLTGLRGFDLGLGLSVRPAGASWKPSPLFIVELNGRRNTGRLAEGDFTQALVGTRFRVNVAPDLQLNSYLRYDNETDNFGTNTRLRWTLSPLGDLFVVYNHNVARTDTAEGVPSDPFERHRWALASNELLVRFQYTFRY
jgi:hypothetical protein